MSQDLPSQLDSEHPEAGFTFSTSVSQETGSVHQRFPKIIIFESVKDNGVLAVKHSLQKGMVSIQSIIPVLQMRKQTKRDKVTQVKVPTTCGLGQGPRALFNPRYKQSWSLTVTGEPAKWRFPGPILSKSDLVSLGEDPEIFLWLLEDQALRKTPSHHDSSPRFRLQWHGLPVWWIPDLEEHSCL